MEKYNFTLVKNLHHYSDHCLSWVPSYLPCQINGALLCYSSIIIILIIRYKLLYKSALCCCADILIREHVWCF